MLYYTNNSVVFVNELFVCLSVFFLTWLLIIVRGSLKSHNYSIMWATYLGFVASNLHLNRFLKRDR